MRLEPHRPIFIGEIAVTTKMTRLRGRSLRGARLEADAPFGHWRTQILIAELRVGGLAAPWVLDGPINRAAFEAYIGTQLAPCLQPGEVVSADNLSSHKSAVAQAFLKAQGNDLRPCFRTLGYFTPVHERGTKWDSIDGSIQRSTRRQRLSGFMRLERHRAALRRSLVSLAPN